jgi:hypothetical protein
MRKNALRSARPTRAAYFNAEIPRNGRKKMLKGLLCLCGRWSARFAGASRRPRLARGQQLLHS